MNMSPHASMPFTERVRISTGLQCNARCVFCYYNDELNTQTYTTGAIKGMLDTAKQYGIRDVDFSGGEPTIRRDLPELLIYAEAQGFRRICVITNGLKTADKSFLSGLREAGLNELLISLHGPTPDLHDGLVGVPGAFRKVRRTMEHCAALSLRFRINTVVTRTNYRMLENFAPLCTPHKPAAYNFIFFNDWVNAAPLAAELCVRYSVGAPFLKRALDALSSDIPKVTARYIPFCFMAGHEKHVCNLLQNDYDNDEWQDAVKRLVTDGALSEGGGGRLAAYFEKLNRFVMDCPDQVERLLSADALTLLRERSPKAPFTGFPPALARAAHIIENHLKRSTYVKSDRCGGCAYGLICDGLEQAYAQVNGMDELKPIAGDPVTDAMHFRRPYVALSRSKERETG